MPNCKTAVPYRGTPEQEERLRKVIEEHKGQPGATMPVLQAAQEIFGYLPEEVQIMVAEGLDIPLSEVYGVSTFYSFFTLNQGKVPDFRLSGHRLLRQRRCRRAGRGGEKAGHLPWRHHEGRAVLSGRLPVHRRMRSGPGHDDQ